MPTTNTGGEGEKWQPGMLSCRRCGTMLNERQAHKEVEKLLEEATGALVTLLSIRYPMKPTSRDTVLKLIGDINTVRKWEFE